MSGLSPVPFERLVARAFEELARNGSVFDLPARKFFIGDVRHDTSLAIHGRRVSAPLGPSAGPHTQMAQNIVLAWLGGARFFELKTVQIRDSLAIPRPCIDVREVGLNVEWSQELRLEQSLEEYVKASMLIEMLSASGAVAPLSGFGDHLFDMSVGYDLEGIRSPRLVRFMRGLLDARKTIDALRRRIPDKWAPLRQLDFESCIAPSVTVSTFHGCPVSEIEKIGVFLMRDLGLDCTIKLNPTLLGARRIHELLHDRLGFRDVHIPPTAFENDPEWDEAAEIVERLRQRAKRLGRHFAVKLTNTLLVENRSHFLPASESVAYLSGAPLHVIAMHLAARFREEFEDTLPISFSAGIDRWNYPDAVRAGLAPVTVCTDLLRQGGYGRLQGYGMELAARMDAAGASTLAEFVTGDVESYLDALDHDPRYRSAHLPRKVRKSGRPVTPEHCAMCDLCIGVCPNAAMFRGAPPFEIICLADLCNDCGNCETFCPDSGAPNREKLRVGLDSTPPHPAFGHLLPRCGGGEGTRDPQQSEIPVAGGRRPGEGPSEHVNFLNCLSLEDR